MRNLKKFLALVLAMLMIVSASAAVSASDFSDVADDSIYAEAIADLVEKGITNGVAAGQFGPDQPVQRFQMALFMARALEPDVDDWMTGMQVFDDVNEWYGAIAYAYVNNIVTGMGNNLFAPHDGIRYQDALIMALRALGYTVDISGDPYWLAAYNQAQALGLTKGVEVYVGEQVLTRAETAQIIFNMLKTTPADGGLTLNEKNFGEATAANKTVFVVTATPKQSYYDSAISAEEGYLGLQEIVNGIPSGEVLYLSAKDLGIDEDEIENYFSHSFDFVNYDENTQEYDRIIPGKDPVILYNTDITKINSSRIRIDGVAYNPVEEFSGSKIINEMVIFNASEYSTSGKILLFNRDGDITDENGNTIAKFAYETSTGVRYYVDENVTSGDARVISESAALEKYGVAIDDVTYNKYATLTADGLESYKNYQIALYDDDGDEYFERAVVTPVWMSVFKAKNGNGTESFGPMADSGHKDIVYTEDLTAGEVFTYTFNDQADVVTVLEVIPVQSGILTKINTTDIGNSNVKLTIDGEEYILANETNEGKVGATIAANGKNNNVAFDKIAGDDKKLGYLYSSDAQWGNLVVGARIMYYAVGDYIINAKTYNVEDDYDRIILDEIVSYDSNNIYVDLYNDGKLQTNVAISAVNGEKISDLNIFELSRLLSDDIWESGNLFKFIEYTDDSFELSGAFDRDYAAAGTDKNLAAEAFKYGLYNLGGTADIEFIDGIADLKDGGQNLEYIDNILRTNDDTVFYFIDEDGDVNVYVGAPDNSSIDLAQVKLYADKIGYGSATKNGVASFVVVYYNSANASAIKGFGFTSVDYSVIFVGASSAVNKYERVSASYIGLGSAYTGTYYSYNVDNLAVDMGTGAEVQKVYSKVILEQGHFYKVDANGVINSADDDVTDDNTMIKSASLAKADFEQARYYTIDKAGVDGSATKVSTVKLALYDFEGTVKTDDFAWFDKAYDVYYIVDYEDGSFVGIVDKDYEADVDNRGNVNAMWTGASTKQYAAIADYDVTANTISGDVYVASNGGSAVSFPGYYADIAVDDAWIDLTSSDYTLSSVTLTKGNTDIYVNATVTINSSNIVEFSVTSARNPADPFSSVVNLSAGNYILTITFNGNAYFTIPVTID